MQGHARVSGLYSLTNDEVLRGKWPASCSTQYARGREALRLELSRFAGIADCNGSFILHWR